MPGYYGSDKTNNPHKKSKKESIALILLGGPDRDPDSDNKDMSPEDYAMSIADKEQVEAMAEIPGMDDMPDLPVDEIMEALSEFDIPQDLLMNIKMHLTQIQEILELHKVKMTQELLNQQIQLQIFQMLLMKALNTNI